MKYLFLFLTLHIALLINHKSSLYAQAIVSKDRSFSVVALGDMPYFLPQDNLKFENVVRYLNTQDQRFNVFVGDFKSSITDCSDSIYLKMKNYFNLFDKPLIYTPGDNEWTDCMPSFTKEERLNYLRDVFFSTDSSLGKNKLNLISQSNYKGFEKFVENKRWELNNISLGTLHLVGSNNNLIIEKDISNKEFEERSAANSFWMKEIFAKASKNNALGIILFVHADMFLPDKGSSGFSSFLKELNELTETFKKPVLLVNGDSHIYLIDKPLKKLNSNATLLNFTRAQVFGEYDMHAIKIIVNSSNKDLFEIQPLIIPQPQ